MKSSKIQFFIIVSRFALAAGLVFLSASIFHFGQTIKSMESSLPTIAEKTQTASESVQAAAIEIRRIIPFVPDIIEETKQTRETIPKMLAQTEVIMNRAVDAVAMVSAIHESVPAILEESKQVRQESKQIRQELPAILNELSASREIVAQTTVEIENVRQSLPGTLNHLDTLLDKADKTGKRASEGAVSGVLTGIVKAPYSIVKGLGKGVFDKEVIITDEDRQVIRKKVLIALEEKKVGDVVLFENDNSAFQGFIEVAAIDKRGGSHCRTLRISVVEHVDKVLKRFCFDEHEGWVLSDIPK